MNAPDRRVGWEGELGRRFLQLSAFNVAGCARHDIAKAGQFSLGVTADIDRYAGLKGGVFQATLTARRGEDPGRVAGLDTLQQVQEIYGRGHTVRLTQFWYEQHLGDWRLKVGRSSPGEDFAALGCDFQNLSLCGAAPGNIVGDYWYNSPISQWSARLRVDRGRAYLQAAAYEVNPGNLDKSLTVGRLHGVTGVLVPIEFGWRRGPSSLPGTYKIGAWRSLAEHGGWRRPSIALAHPATPLRRADQPSAAVHGAREGRRHPVRADGLP